MKLDEQVNTIERALGERMINHAIVILRKWQTELNSPQYNDQIEQLSNNYRRVFDYYISIEDPERERILDEMTGDTYRLVDSLYADLRIKQGLSPDIHSFNADKPQSIMRYFSTCVHLTPEDYAWLEDILTQTEESATALLAIAALSQNLRECFSEISMTAIINAIQNGNTLTSDQALSTCILLLAHYDVRIDFFPTLQNDFCSAIGDGEHAFETLCALVRSAKMNLKDMLASGELTPDDMPDALKELLGMGNNNTPLDKIASWMPESEKEYMAGLIDILPDTWVYSAIVGDDPERIQKIQKTYLSIGKMDLMWDQLEEAEEWLIERLCSPKATPTDYINYGHCCFVRGDRMMAYENYRVARSRCGSAKAFYALFRPDRHFLVEHGIPVEQVYLMEDQLILDK